MPRIFYNKSSLMHYAIIAAGEGSRLRQEGVAYPKPLVPIEGEPMIDRLIGIFSRCGAESISVICNREMTEVRQHLTERFARAVDNPKMNLVVESTPSSMHSLARLSEVIPEGKVCVTTVDTIFREEEFRAYIQAFEQMEGGLFAVTSFVDDEKPLWVAASSADTSTLRPIIGFFDRESEMPQASPRLVSGGIYGLDTRTAWPVLHRCLQQGQSRMRNYQRALVSAGIPLQAYLFDKIMDIDHADDIRKAEEWLASTQRKERILTIRRAPGHSPNNIEKDAAILEAVAQCLEARGYVVDRIDEAQLTQMPLAEIQQYGRVLHMARRMPSLTRITQSGVSAINAPQAVSKVAMSREWTFTMLRESGIQVPSFWAYDPEEDEMFQCEPELQQLLPAWVKATRNQGAQPDDVMWVETPLQADSRVIELAAERVPDIIVMKHVEGDLLKVYAVTDGENVWLRSFYPQEAGYSKFGEAEQHNSPLAHHPFEAKTLRTIAVRIAQTLELSVFGFDAIVAPDGTIYVIDVNDWPSFSACRQEAAERIARLV